MRKETRFLIFSLTSFLFAVVVSAAIFPVFTKLFLQVGVVTASIIKGLNPVFFSLIGFSFIFLSVAVVVYSLIYLINRIRKKTKRDTKEGRESLFRSIDLMKTKTNSFSGSKLSRPKAQKITNEKDSQDYFR